MFLVTSFILASLASGALSFSNYGTEVAANAKAIGHYRMDGSTTAFSSSIAPSLGDGTWGATNVLIGQTADSAVVEDPTNKYIHCNGDPTDDDFYGKITVSAPMFFSSGFGFSIFFKATGDQTGVSTKYLVTSVADLNQQASYNMTAYASYAKPVAGKVQITCAVEAGDLSWAATAQSAQLDNGNWYQVFCNYNSTTMQIYINGAMQEENALLGTIASTVGSNCNQGGCTETTVGQAASNTEDMKVQIDEFAVFSDALSAEEVDYLFQVSQNEKPELLKQPFQIPEAELLSQPLTVIDEQPTSALWNLQVPNALVLGSDIQLVNGLLTMTASYDLVYYNVASNVYNLTVTYTDQYKASTTELFELTVVNKNRKPTFDAYFVSGGSVSHTSGTQFSFNEGTLLYIQANATDADIDEPLVMSVQSSGVGHVFQAQDGIQQSMGLFQWTLPNIAQDTQYEVTLTVLDFNGGDDVLAFNITVIDVVVPTTTGATTTLTQTTPTTTTATAQTTAQAVTTTVPGTTTTTTTTQATGQAVTTTTIPGTTIPGTTTTSTTTQQATTPADNNNTTTTTTTTTTAAVPTTTITLTAPSDEGATTVASANEVVLNFVVLLVATLLNAAVML